MCKILKITVGGGVKNYIFFKIKTIIQTKFNKSNVHKKNSVNISHARIL